MAMIEKLTKEEMLEVNGGAWIYIQELDEWIWIEDDEGVDDPCASKI